MHIRDSKDGTNKVRQSPSFLDLSYRLVRPSRTVGSGFCCRLCKDCPSGTFPFSAPKIKSVVITKLKRHCSIFVIVQPICRWFSARSLSTPGLQSFRSKGLRSDTRFSGFGRVFKFYLETHISIANVLTLPR
jgi:hypothetical protein